MVRSTVSTPCLPTAACGRGKGRGIHVIKKGPREPLDRAPPRLAGGVTHPRRCASLPESATWQRKYAQLCPSFSSTILYAWRQRGSSQIRRESGAAGPVLLQTRV